MLRIKDIAKKAGVSPTTVSNVIHKNEKNVSRETAKRVERILEEYGYIPSVSARMLAGGSSGIICVLAEYASKNIEGHGQRSVMLRVLEEEISQRGYYMIVHFAHSAEECLQFILTWKAEGVITLGLEAADNLKIQARGKMPVVSIDGYYEDNRKPKNMAENGRIDLVQDAVPNVGADDFGGGYLMGTHLLQCRHRRIHFFSEKNNMIEKMRWYGLQRACLEAGIQLTEEDYSPLPTGKKKRMEFHKKHLAALAFGNDALFFATDYLAMEAEGYLMDMGIQVPEEISVAGFGNSDFALLGRPRLTTVHQDIPDKAVKAVKKLFRLIQGDAGAISDEKIMVRLVVRESVLRMAVRNTEDRF